MQLLGNRDEEFQVSQDGKVIKSPDFNYWGVTFQRDSNFFYATLRTGGTIRSRDFTQALTVIQGEGVEALRDLYAERISTSTGTRT